VDVAYQWNVSANGDDTACCGDDAGETNMSRTCSAGVCTSSGSDVACCSASTKCVYGGACYANGYTGNPSSDGTNEKCSSGTWTDAQAPTCSISSIDKMTNATYEYVTGTTIYYNNATGGQFVVNITASDTGGSGMQKVNFPDTVSTGGDDASSPYSLQYSWTGTSSYTGASTVTAYDNAGNTGTCSFTVTKDITAPSGGSISYTNATQTTTAVAITFNTGTDGGSGLNSGTGVIYSQSCAMSGSRCVPSGSWTLFNTTTTSPQSFTATSGNCYYFIYNISDNVNNAVSYTNLNTTCIDTSAPTVNAPILYVGTYTNSGNSGAYFKGTVSAKSVISDSGGSGLNTGTCQVSINGAGYTGTGVTSDASDCYYNSYNPAATFTIAFKVSDNAGNTGTSSTSNFNYDATVPTVAYQGQTPVNNSRDIANSVTVNVSVVDTNTSIDSCLIEWQGSNISMTKVGSGTSISCTYTTATVDGTTYTYKVYANDSLNNMGTVVSQTFLENTAPGITSNVLSSASGTNSTVENLTATYSATDAQSDALYNFTDWRLGGVSIATLDMPFDANVSSVSAGAVTDYSTFGNNGTLGGGTAANAPTWTSSGKIEGAYVFDGTGKIINVTDTVSLRVESAPFTIETWVNPKVVQQQVIMFKGTAAMCSGWILVMNRFANDIDLAKGCVIDQNVSYTFTANNWYHIAAVQNSGSVSFYINGNFIGTFANAAAYISSSGENLRIGGDDTVFSKKFNGTIDEVKIYNRSLSAEQIYQDYLTGNLSKATNILVSNETASGNVWSELLGVCDGYECNTSVSNSVHIIASMNTIWGNATSWTWAPATVTQQVRSGNATSWTWTSYTPGSGRKIANGTATSWVWSNE